MRGFEDVSESAGLIDFFPTRAYTSLDIVALSINVPIWIHENRSARANSIAFELRDERGN